MPRGKGIAIRVLASNAEEEVAPLFIGREDGTIEKYIAAEDADLGRPSLLLRGHRAAVTGIVVVNADEIFSCSLDGSIKQWNAAVEAPPPPTSSLASSWAAAEGGNRVVRSLDGTVPLHCLAQQASTGRLYAGGADGALHVVDGDRRSVWPGHLEPITCIAFALNDLVVTGGMDRQVLVWDATQGKPFRLLEGHAKPVTGIAVVPPDEDALAEEDNAMESAAPEEEFGPQFFLSPAQGAIVTFGEDGTAKVWAIPDPALEEAEAEAEAGAAASTGQGAGDGDGEDDEAGPGHGDRGKRPNATVVSFQIPEGAEAAEGEESETYHKKRVSFEATPVMTIAADNDGGDAATTDDGDAAAAADGSTGPAASEALSVILNPPVGIKSVLKAPERPHVRRSDPLGTIAFPEVPYVVYQPPGYAEGNMAEEDDGSGLGGAAGLVYVGSIRGTVWGLALPQMVHRVLGFVAESRQRVNREVRSTKRVLRQSEALLKKECRKAVKAETEKQIRAARKVQAAKRKAEQERKREERQAAARAAAEERRRNAEYSDEEDEDEDDFNEEDEEELDEEDEEREEEEEEDPHNREIRGDAEDGAAAALAHNPALRVLSPEQRTALEAFIKEKEAARDERLAELRKAVEAHLAQVKPLAKTTYESSSSDFARLPFTSYASVAPSATPPTVGGPVPPVMRSDVAAKHILASGGAGGGASVEGEVVRALLQARGRVYASQADRVAITTLTPGVIKL